MSKPLIPRQPFSIDELHNKLNVLLASFNPKIEINQDLLLITVSKDKLYQLLKLLHDDTELGFRYLSTITARDHTPNKPRFSVDYTIFGLETHSFYALVRVWVDDGEALPSVCHIWRNSDWHERENYDLLGINFTDHPYTLDGHPRRMFLPDNWDGFPLRKEYPVQGKPVWNVGCNVITPSFETPESIDDYIIDLPAERERK